MKMQNVLPAARGGTAVKIHASPALLFSTE
jgi:hypothetical protein